MKQAKRRYIKADEYREYAAAGMTVSDVARLTGRRRWVISDVAKRAGFQFRKGAPGRPKKVTE